MIKRINDCKFILEVGEIEKQQVDAIFVWTTPTLNSGDSTFIKTHKEAGSVIYEECLEATMKYGKQDINKQFYIPAGQTIITRGGNLEAYTLIHGVMPNYKVKVQRDNRQVLLNNLIIMGSQLVKAYADMNFPIVNIIFPPIPELIYGKVENDDIKVFLKAILRLQEFKKVSIMCTTQEEYDKYEKIFRKLTIPFWERIINKVIKLEF